MDDCTQEECEILCALIRNRTGMNLKNKHTMLKMRAKKEMKRLQVVDFKRYIRKLATDDETWEDFFDLIAVNYTYFMRESEQFQFLKKELLRRKDTDTPIRIWSAGCATGEECYTIAMIAREAGVPVEILGTDISNHELEHGRLGVYQLQQMCKVPSAWRSAFFEPKGKGYRVRQDLQECVKFQKHNLIKEFHANQPFDFIFCRNVLGYMDISERCIVLERFYQNMKEDGYLFLGNGECVHSGLKYWRFVGHSVYRKKQR